MGSSPKLSSTGERRVHSFSHVPEVSLVFLSFFLNFFWEVAQTYFYTLRDFPFSTMLYGWLHCTVGDVLITLGSFWLVSLVAWDRRWFLNLKAMRIVAFVMVGLGYTVLSELLNVHILRSWGYNESMPLIPVSRVGLTPVLQWAIVPWFTILLLRSHVSLVQQAERER